VLELDLAEFDLLRSLTRCCIWVYFEVMLNRSGTQNLLRLGLDQSFTYGALGQSYRLAMGNTAFICFLSLRGRNVLRQVVILDSIIS
jgi:hypothetical protein